MVELVITLSIIAALLTVGIPSFASWIQNSHIRNAAEAIQNGLQLARAEAVRRNTGVRFTLDSVAAGTTGSNWTVQTVNTAEAIQTRPEAEGSRNAAVAVLPSTATTVVFDGLGRATPASTINISNPSGGSCATGGGPMRCLRVVVTAGGQIRMCDTALAATDPRSCS